MTQSRRFNTLLALMLWATAALALHVVPVGEPDKDYTFVDNSGDSIYIFADEIHMHHNGATTWYDATGQLAPASGLEDFYPDEGSYYIEEDGKKEYFYVFSYKNYKANTADWKLTLTPTCDASTLTLTGTLPKAMSYTLADGRIRTLARYCTISYTDIAWGGTEWKDSAAVMTREFPQTQFALPALYKATDISLAVDNIAHALGLEADSVTIGFDEPIAVKSHITHTTEKRDAKNELEYPNDGEMKDDESITAHSAELRVQFYSNPTPAATYFSWRVYKGSELLYSRNDEILREVFSEPSVYRVVSTVRGISCPCETCAQDSSEVTVSISASDLRVPNIFTPNGDGVNDEFRVQYRSIAEFHCWVYNRWGRLVYQWSDPAKGWDGTINGRPAPEGAYFYVIRARGTDADPKQGYLTKGAYKRARNKNDESILGIYQLSGDINLIRGK